MKDQKEAALIDQKLSFNPALEVELICDFIKSEVKRRGSHGVLLGLSGGLDSTTCAYLCVRSLPRDQIHLMSLPERDSDPVPYRHAHEVAERLGLPVSEKNLSELFGLLGLYQFVPQNVAGDRPMLERSIGILRRLSGSASLFPWAQKFAFAERRGWAARVLHDRLWTYSGKTEAFVLGKVRTRMLVLSTQAMLFDSLLVCTTDRSEWSVGFYDPLGDGAGDIAPLRHLYKTQIREVARALGVAEEIIAQPSSGDLAAGLPNEVAMGLSYEKLDRVLVGLELGLDSAEVASQAGVRRSMVEGIRSACKVADDRRKMPLGLATGE